MTKRIAEQTNGIAPIAPWCRERFLRRFARAGFANVATAAGDQTSGRSIAIDVRVFPSRYVISRARLHLSIRSLVS
jgi:hypothetical protein